MPDDGALLRRLRELDGQKVTIKVDAQVNDDAIEKFVRRLNRKGGPKIARHVISDR